MILPWAKIPDFLISQTGKNPHGDIPMKKGRFYDPVPLRGTTRFF